MLLIHVCPHISGRCSTTYQEHRFVKGDSNEVFPPEAAFNAQEQLVNAKGGAKLYFIKGTYFVLARMCAALICVSPGAQGCLGVVPENASIANRVFASFLASLPPARSDSVPVALPLDNALQRLAEIMHDTKIANREPSSPMAFSCVPSVVVRGRAEVYARAALGHRGAFSPLDPNGRPKRRYVVCPSPPPKKKSKSPDGGFIHALRFSSYSDRLQEQWFEVDRHGISYSGAPSTQECMH